VQLLQLGQAFQSRIRNLRAGQCQIMKMVEGAQEAKIVVVRGTILEIDARHRPIVGAFLNVDSAAQFLDAGESAFLIHRHEPEPTRGTGADHRDSHGQNENETLHRRTSLCARPSFGGDEWTLILAGSAPRLDGVENALAKR
jgi:hypothetical protein